MAQIPVRLAALPFHARGHYSIYGCCGHCTDGEEYGEERLIAAVRGNGTQTPAQLNAHLLKQAKQFCDSQMADDATLIVVAVQNAQ